MYTGRQAGEQERMQEGKNQACGNAGKHAGRRETTCMRQRERERSKYQERERNQKRKRMIM